MTVYIEKPAFNLREELASLRNQGGYQEQQFYFDNLVTNGTFDADTDWTLNGTAEISSGTANNLAADDYIAQGFNTEVGKTYLLSFDFVSGNTGSSLLRIGTSLNSFSIFSGGASSNTSKAFTATSTTTWVTFYQANFTAEYDNVSVFEVDANDDVIYAMPKGWKPKDVFEDGLLQREGAAYDYEVVYDGFDYVVKPTVAPSITTQTCVIGVKA